MVRFLGMTERQATDRIARLLLAHNEHLREDARRRGLKDWHLAWSGRAYLHPCQQLHDLSYDADAGQCRARFLLAAAVRRTTETTMAQARVKVLELRTIT
jgi:hypothetical protein